MHEEIRRVYSVDGASPAVTAKKGGNHEPKIADPSIVIGSMQKNAYVGDGEKCPTLTQAMGAGGGQTPMIGFSEQTPQDHIEVGKQIRVRKLTERECGRLMGVKDEDIDHVARHQSKSSQYHLYGDSIVVPVLMAIFAPMFDKTLTEEHINEIYKGV